MSKKEQNPDPELVREYVNTLASLLDGYLTICSAPSSDIQVRVQKLYEKLRQLISSELRLFGRPFEPWEQMPSELPADDEALDDARVRWRRGESHLQKFMELYARHAMSLEASELSMRDVSRCQDLQQEADQVLREAEEADLAKMREPGAIPTQTAQDEDTALQRLVRCFDRPALYTPFFQETSLADFRKAITDTIEALNTGIRRLRDGTFIERVMQRHDFADPDVRHRLDQIEKMVVNIRTQYVAFHHDGQIQCKLPPGSPFQEYLVQQSACRTMDELRASVLDAVRRLVPTFTIMLHRDASILSHSLQVDNSGRVRIGVESTAVPTAPPRWSKAMTITQLAERYDVDRKTMAAILKSPDGDGIHVMPLGNMFCVALDDLPAEEYSTDHF